VAELEHDHESDAWPVGRAQSPDRAAQLDGKDDGA